MPAVMDDPIGPTIHRVSGQPPFPNPNRPGLPADIVPRQVTLRDRQTVATIVPFASRHQVPGSLQAYLCDQLNREIEGGDTYPMLELFTTDAFADYWFRTFAAVMLLGSIKGADEVMGPEKDWDWARECLGSFFIKPNYPGRSSHVCNASFITTDASRNRGVGRLMGEAYIDWAPRLGYTYSVFNLVYETNVASCRIWDALGFKRIGRVKACGNLRSYPDRLIDAIIYGRDLGPGGAESEELVSEERFDKIRFYLKYGKYPNGADRAEKSRLRSAATHYKLLEGDKLMLKDKEVISDPARQYEIARNVHAIHHGGINKTTATIAERHHWSRIKETVSEVIRACAECKELGKTPNQGGGGGGGGRKTTTTTTTTSSCSPGVPTGPLQQQQQQQCLKLDHAAASHRVLALQQDPSCVMISQPPPSTTAPLPSSSDAPNHHPVLHHSPPDDYHPSHHMLQDEASTAAAHASFSQPIDPQMIAHRHHATQPPPDQDDVPFEHYHPHADFQALLNATGDDVPSHDPDAEAAAAVYRDLEMLIEHDNALDGLEASRRAETETRDGPLYGVAFGDGE